MIFSAAFVVLVSLFLSQGALAAPNRNTRVTASPTSVFSPALISLANAVVTSKGPAPIAVNPIAVAIHTITNKSTTLNLAVGKVTPQQSVDVITAAAAVTVHSFADIVAVYADAIAVLKNKPMISAAATNIIVDGFARFANVHQSLLNTVIARHNTFAQFALTAPLTAVLRANKAGIEALTSALVVVIPSKKAIIQKQISGLDSTLTSSVSVYSQVCRPSATYPKTQPKCLQPGS